MIGCYSPSSLKVCVSLTWKALSDHIYLALRSKSIHDVVLNGVNGFAVNHNIAWHALDMF